MLRLISLAMLVCAMSLPTFAADVDLDADSTLTRTPIPRTSGQ